ncbi:papain-like cysteine protease family protein [Terrisporobacter mayombei]|uniref:Peptidase C39-like domain-containing protein n=1 Tax=Terrisporobacter mayombei TaxID=1541 RepID=A0ABY9PXJ7_9FIRM|nr:papain-like cysteine protease family protein [Terrisporobacter mayombei]MCC3868252.1 hypothetical protein [Terrisporobacter mayombei]WMT80392.1 hypothetical protein TEMA_07080 [Terrisporobacter mayombei]
MKFYKISAMILVSIICIVASFVTSNAANKTLSVPQQAQKWNNTCWASSSSMTSAYFKGNTTNYEKSILQYIKGSSVNGDSISARGTVVDVVKGVKYITGKAGSYKLPAPSYTAIKYQINKIVRWLFL